MVVKIEIDKYNAPWHWEDSALIDSEGNEVIGIFPAHGEHKTWLMVGKEHNQLLLEHAPEMFTALKIASICLRKHDEHKNPLCFIDEVISKVESI